MELKEPISDLLLKSMHLKIKGRNNTNKGEQNRFLSHQKINLKSKLYNDKDKNITMKNNNFLHIQNITIKQLNNFISIDSQRPKRYKSKRMNSSAEHLKKVTSLLRMNLPKKYIDNSINFWELQSNRDNKLPKLIHNELIKKSISIPHYENNKYQSELLVKFPYIKKINIIKTNQQNKIKTKNNNYRMLIRKKNPNSNFSPGKYGVKSIYLDHNLIGNNKHKFYPNYQNNSNKKLNNLLSRQNSFKNNELVDINILNINKKQIKIKNEDNFNDDLLLNDKGTLINFNEKV